MEKIDGQNKSKSICSVCGIESSSLSRDHNNPWACITALKHKNFELEKQLQVERQARFDWLVTYIWDDQCSRKLNHLVRKIMFQQVSLDGFLSSTDLERIKAKSTEKPVKAVILELI